MTTYRIQTPISGKSPRNYALDIIKGIAICFEFHTHCGYRLLQALDYYDVPCFFIVAGILFRPGTSLGAYAKKKALRLIPAYILYNTVQIIVNAVINRQIPSAYDLYAYTIDPVNHPLWYLKAMFWAMMLAIILWRCSCYTTTKRSCATALSTALIAIVAAHLSWPRLGYLSGIPQGLIGLALTSVGIALRPFIMNLRPLPRCLVMNRWQHLAIGAVAFLLGALILTKEQHFIYPFGTYNCSIFFPAALLMVGAAYAIAVAVKRCPPLEFIGRYSMSYFSIHYIVLTILENLGMHYNWLMVPTAFAVTTIIVMIITRIPFMQRHNLT